MRIERKTFRRERIGSGGGDSDTYTPDMLLNAYIKYDRSVVAVQQVDHEHVSPGKKDTYLEWVTYLITYR